MSAIVDERIFLLRVADLAEVHLLVRHLPEGNALAVALTILVAAHVLVAGRLLDEGPLAVSLVISPVAFVRVAGRILHLARSVALAEKKLSRVRRAIIRDVRSGPVVVALEELAAVVVPVEGRLNGLMATEGADRMSPAGRPQVLRQLIRIRQESSLGIIGPPGTGVSTNRTRNKRRGAYCSLVNFSPTI